jgi:hypothetical protein
MMMVSTKLVYFPQWLFGQNEVEFSDRNGRTYESLGLSASQFIILHFEPINPNLMSEMMTAKV